MKTIKIKVITNAKKERIIKDGEIFPRAKRETAPLFERNSHSNILQKCRSIILYVAMTRHSKGS